MCFIHVNHSCDLCMYERVYMFRSYVEIGDRDRGRIVVGDCRVNLAGSGGRCPWIIGGGVFSRGGVRMYDGTGAGSAHRDFSGVVGVGVEIVGGGVLISGGVRMYDGTGAGSAHRDSFSVVGVVGVVVGGVRTFAVYVVGEVVDVEVMVDGVVVDSGVVVLVAFCCACLLAKYSCLIYWRRFVGVVIGVVVESDVVEGAFELVVDDRVVVSLSEMVPCEVVGVVVVVVVVVVVLAVVVGEVVSCLVWRPAR